MSQPTKNTSILTLANVSEEDCMLQFIKELKLYPKSIPEAVKKYSHQNLFKTIWILPSSAEVIYTTGASYWTTGLLNDLSDLLFSFSAASAIF